MAKVICITSQKGGAGKTTSTHNIGVELAKRNFKTLLIDLDPSGNLTKAVGYNREIFDDKINACDLFEKNRQIEVYQAKTKNLFIIPATTELGVYRKKLILEHAGEKYLKRGLRGLLNIFDFILIDTPPQVDQLVVNAHVASDYLIISTECSDMSTTNLDDSIAFYNTCVEDELNEKLKLLGVIATQFRIVDKDQTKIVNELKKDYNLMGVVRQSKDATVGLKEGKSAIESRPYGEVASSYRIITNQVLNAIRREEKNGF